MRKYKGLSRVFLLGYFAALFGATLFGLLLTKFNVALAVSMMILSVLDFAAIIVARAMFSKHYRAFFIISIIAFSVLNVLVLGGFILELIFIAQGIGAKYAIIIGSINTAFVVLIDIFYPLGIKKVNNRKLAEEGIVPNSEEDDI